MAGERRRFGYWRLHILLRREGWQVNHKTVHRIYREEGLQVRKRKRKRLAKRRYRQQIGPAFTARFRGLKVADKTRFEQLGYESQPAMLNELERRPTV